MRPQPEKPIEARGKVLGGSRPLVCVPLVGKTRGEILAEAENIPAIAPDIIELRVDAWEFVEETAPSVSMIQDVRKAVGEIPVILTCRGRSEIFSLPGSCRRRPGGFSGRGACLR